METDRNVFSDHELPGASAVPDGYATVALRDTMSTVFFPLLLPACVQSANP